MTQKIVVAGSGFAGMWAALAAARAVSMAGKESDIAIAVVSPKPELHIRPRFYETAFDEMAPDIGPLFDAVGVEHVPGWVEAIRPEARQLEVRSPDDERVVLPYDRFVLAVGSTVFLPEIPGLQEHAFNVDQLSSAVALDEHLHSLAERPESPSRNTVVIAGGGFTGIETAADMPKRLRAILGDDTALRVVLLERAQEIGPDLGPGPRPYIEEALASEAVEVMMSTAAVSVDADGVTTASGERIPAQTVVWTAGLRAHPLAAQIPGEHDSLGRVHVDRELRAKGAGEVFVAGDTALAATDDLGNTALMSCQHALSLGRYAGHNAAADLLGQPLLPYSQPKYVTCLDLGPWGAVYSEGWEREVKMVREDAKALKRSINTEWIYPPKPDRETALAAADPATVIVA